MHQPWIEDSNLITAAGVSGAIDMAHHLAAKLTSEAKAKQVQLEIEYDFLEGLGTWPEDDC